MKDNLSGHFTYKGYVRNTRPDVKFGHNNLGYVCQIPVVGLIVGGSITLLIECVVSPFVLYQKIKECKEGKLKQNAKRDK